VGGGGRRGAKNKGPKGGEIREGKGVGKTPPPPPTPPGKFQKLWMEMQVAGKNAGECRFWRTMKTAGNRSVFAGYTDADLS